MRAAVCLLALLAASPAAATGDPPMILSNMLGQALSRSMITYPIFPGQFQLKLAPGYVVAKDARKGWSNDVTGKAVTLAASYGLGPHWALSVMAGYADQSGDGVFGLAPSGVDGTNMQPMPTPKAPQGNFAAGNEGSGWLVNASLVWDHWTGDGFRCPVYLGAGYLSLEETSDNPAVGLMRTGRVASPTIALGVAPAFNTGRWFRWTVSLLMHEPLDAGSGRIADYVPGTGAVNSELRYERPGGMESAVMIGAVELLLRPLGLSLAYTPPIEGATSYSLKWSRRWGPQSAASAR